MQPSSTPTRRITGKIELTSKVKACSPDKVKDTHDLVIYTVKSTYDVKALPQMMQ